MGKRAMRPLVVAAGAVVVAAGCNLGVARQPIDVPAVAVAGGDLNGDGNVDLATAGAGTVAVHLSDGAGAVTTTTYINDDPTGSSSYSGVEVLDGDGDGDLDLAVVRHYERIGGADVRLWPNDGSASFGDPRSLGGGGFVRGMAVGDVDGDGDDDLAFVDDVATWVASGNGSAPSTTVALSDSGGRGVGLADLDGDGLDDVVVGRSPLLPGGPSEPEVSVYFATGGGGFTAPVRYPTGSSLPLPEAVRVADVDADGALDLLVASISNAGSLADREARLSVLPGVGDGTFGAAEVVDRKFLDGSNVEVADVDADGALDVVLGGIEVLFGDGTGAFPDGHGLALSPGGDGYPTGGEPDAVAVDLDEDGVTDLAVANSRLDLFLNRLNGARDHD